MIGNVAGSSRDTVLGVPPHSLEPEKVPETIDCTLLAAPH